MVAVEEGDGVEVVCGLLGDLTHRHGSGCVRREEGGICIVR